MMAEEELENAKAWDLWVEEALRGNPASGVSEARDLVIEKWLTERGDARPFYDWVLSAGHQPSTRVVRILAAMMAKADSPGFSPKTDAALRFKIEICGDGPGRRCDFEAKSRDYIAGREISKLMDQGWSHSAAEKHVQDWLASEGVAVSNSTTEQARKTARRGRGK